MAFDEYDPLFGRMGQLSMTTLAIQQHSYSIPQNAEDEGGSDRGAEDQGLTRYVYSMTEDCARRWKRDQEDKREEELNEERECLVCSWGAPNGTEDLYQQVLDVWRDNISVANRETLYQLMSEKYREKIYEPLLKSKRASLKVPLLKARHFRRHFERCGNNLYEISRDLAMRMSNCIIYKLEKGVRKDNRTGDEEICTVDTQRAIANFLNLAKFAVSGEQQQQHATINISSSLGKRGRQSGNSVSVSALVGSSAQEKRRKRLDKLSLSSYS